MLYLDDRISVRLMQEEDIQKIAAAENDFSESYEAYFHKQLNWQKDGESSAFLAFYNKKIAGYVFLFKKCR